MNDLLAERWFYIGVSVFYYSKLINNKFKLNWRQTAKFFCVTSFIFVFSLILFYILYNLLDIPYQFVVFIVYIATVIFHFSLHRIFTFEASKQNIYLNLVKYSALLLINYLLTVLVSWFVLYFYLSPYLTFCLSPLFTAASSFLFLKYFVFKFRDNF